MFFKFSQSQEVYVWCFWKFVRSHQIRDMLKDIPTVEEMLEETMDEYDEYASQDQHVLCFLLLEI